MGSGKQTVATRHSDQLSDSLTKEAVAALSEKADSDGGRDMDDAKENIEHGVAHPVSGMSELEERVNDLDNSWETESLLAEMIEGLADESVTNGKRLLGHAYEFRCSCFQLDVLFCLRPILLREGAPFTAKTNLKINANSRSVRVR